jgi:hypothetical protein
MRRILPLLVVAALTGCDHGSSGTASSTIALGPLPSTLPEESAPSSTTDEGTAPDTTASGTTGSTAATTASAPPTVFADVLADLVGGRATAAPSDTVVDDTGRLRLAVPRSWSDRRTAPSPLREGEEAPYVAAAPDQTRFFDGYGEPGLTAVVVDRPPEEALGAYRFDDCANEGRHPFTGTRLAGEYEVWRDCGETGSAIVTVAVRQGRTPGTALLLAQVVEPADLAALDHALATLRVGA